MSEKIQCRIIISWYWNYMKTLLVLVSFAEVYIYQNGLTFLINDNIRPLENTLGIKVTVLWDNIRFSEQAVKCC